MPEAVDRRQLAKEQPPKTTKWPPTERRRNRVAAVLARRQPDLTVVLENVHDPHNVGAILRSCDAVGILAVHLVYTTEAPPTGAFARTTSASAAKWIDAHRHPSIDACFDVLRRDGFAILATALGEASTDLYAADLHRPTAIVLGNEIRGVSAEAIAAADGQLSIPMAGMVESLNVSVACAVVLYEAQRQRRVRGAYATPKLDEATRTALAEDWLRR